MARFFLIDHSLKQPGGHHFDYSRCLVAAARQAGLDVTLGTHRQFVPHVGALRRALESAPVHEPAFAGGDLYGAGLDIRPVFRQSTYQPDSLLAGLRHLTRSKPVAAPATGSARFSPGAFVQGWRRRRWRGRRERFVSQFAADLRELFRQRPLHPGDHVFLSTISELELMSLATYLGRDPRTAPVQWHVQFHYNLYAGRRPDYARQADLSEAVSACFLASLARMSYHSVHFYTTSETLAEQYNQLGVGQFNALPYPVAPEFLASRSPARRQVLASADVATLPFTSQDLAIDDQPAPAPVSLDPFSNWHPQREQRPLRITCPGGVRREKQQGLYLQTVVDQIWDRQLAPGNVQLVVQRGSRRWPRRRPKVELETPAIPASDRDVPPIEYLPHPLPAADYVRLIKETDIGLLFYDSQVYYSRRAGILGELLACGKPVIVSAGSWLADQLEPHNYAHVRQQLRHANPQQQWELNQCRIDSRNVPLAGGVISCDQDRHPFVFRIQRPAPADGVAIEFDWHWPQETGSYIRLRMLQRDAHGELLGDRSQTLGCPPDDSRSYALFQLAPGVVELEFRLTNAFDAATANLRNLRVTTLNSETGEPFPTGRLGLIASDESQIAACIDELVEHYDHYRQQATDWAPRWSQMHEPQRVLDYLISVDATQRRAA